MTESVSFKAYLKRDGQDVEVRRFGVDGGAATNFLYLLNKIEAMFPSIQNEPFSVFWQDNDKDYIAIGSDEELIEALTSAVAQPFKLFIHITSQQQNDQGASGQPQAHPGVMCDSCEQPVVGFRYKCVTCKNFDLCGTCEWAGKHSQHFMLRMPVPSSSCHPKFFRKFFGRPHKLHKFARYVPQGAAYISARGCPMSSPREASTPATGDMFDFSALLDFINTLSSPNAQEAQANTAAAASGSATNAQASANSQSAPRPSGVDYLNNIGQVISSILDPLGVDMTFEIRTPSSKADETPAPRQNSPNTEPPAPTSTSPPTSSTQTTPSLSNTSAPPTSTQVASSITNAATSTQLNAPISTQLNAPLNASVPTSTQLNAPLNASVPTSTQLNTSQQNTPIPLPLPQNLYPAVPVLEKKNTTAPARRNSDDWTLINRESPTRTESAMDVDEARAVTHSAQAPQTTPSDPSTAQADSALTDERQRIQDAITNILSMGFNYETERLRELLRRENGDITSVLETLLNNASKK